MNHKLRLVLDFGPLLVFFLAYKLGNTLADASAGQAAPMGLLVATGALILCTLISLAVTYYYEKRLAVMPLVSGVLVTVLGGMTLILQDEVFIKIKPTLVNLLFSLILLGGLCVRRPMLKYLLESAFTLREPGWSKLSLRWGLFFLFLALLNEVIWRSFSTDFWVNFKVFGMFTLTLTFTFAQIPLIKRYLIEEEPAHESR